VILLPRRQVLASAAALSGAALAASCAPELKTAAKLRVGTYKGQTQDLIGPAGEARTPYAIQWAEFVSGNLIAEAILAGALDAGSMSDIPPVFIAAAQPALRQVAVLKSDVNNQIVLVPKGSSIASTADLKGKRIGFVKSTTSHYILLRLLQEQKLAWTDITPVALSPQDGRAAFERGSLDAWVIFGATGFLARQATGARVLTTGLGRLTGNYVIVVAQSVLDDPARSAAAADYLARLQRVYRWTEAHPDATAALVGKATGLPAEVYLHQRRERSGPTALVPVDDAAIASQQQIADTFAAAGLIPGKVDVRPLWSTAFHDVLSRSAA
jgi:sulfonate transport system substrate-binding protein